MISTHAPLAGRDRPVLADFLAHVDDFNPRAPCGARRRWGSDPRHTGSHFNPRAPCGARRQALPRLRRSLAFQPTRPLRGATFQRLLEHWISAISTHAPLAGRDLSGTQARPDLSNFNPRAPCGARRACSDWQFDRVCEFQPTRPLRGATVITARRAATSMISTHAPLAGRDRPVLADFLAHVDDFNPRAPCGARRRWGSDPRHTGSHFNPRAPCGARRQALPRLRRSLAFQPTRPLRGATFQRLLEHWISAISTHAPLAGRDHDLGLSVLAKLHFNPRAPCGARPLWRRR